MVSAISNPPLFWGIIAALIFQYVFSLFSLYMLIKSAVSLKIIIWLNFLIIFVPFIGPAVGVIAALKNPKKPDGQKPDSKLQ